MNVPNPVASAALASPDRPAVVHDDATWTARLFAEEVALRAGRLRALGVVPGDRVALVGPPSVEWALAFHAAGWAGAVAVCLPSRETEAEIARLLDATEPRLLLTAGDAASWRDRVASVRDIGLGGSGGDPLAERDWPLDEVRAVVFSSGTTGQARAIELTTGQLLFSAFGSAVRLGHDPDDRWLCCVPLHHVAGLSILVRCAWMGTCVVLHEQFDAARVARALDHGEASLVSLVPTMLRRVLDAREERPFPASLRAILLGGAPTDDALLDRCRAIRAPLAVTWGMTETASQAATRFVGDLAPDGGSGAPHPFARVETRDGRLVVRGPIATGGTVVSSDLGRVDGNGRVTVIDRADDVIISGGEKIVPVEVERVIAAHPSVDEVAVVGRADPRWGCRPAAFVVPTAGAEVDADELSRWCRGQLVAYKVPVAFAARGALPRSPSGKLLRRRLREELADAPGDMIELPSRPGRRPLDPVLGRLHAASVDGGHVALSEKIDELRRWMRDDLRDVERELTQIGSDSDLRADRAAAHLLRLPGKRLRPLCTLLAARSGDAPLDEQAAAQARALAVAGELIHAATLLHDDVIDRGTERRGAPTSRIVFGNKASVLGGDHLLTEALLRVDAVGNPELVSRMLGVIRKMVAGEALQLEKERLVRSDPATYLRIVEGKTAALFAWCLRAGGVVAGLPPGALEVLDAVGRPLGIAFQLIDDLLDIEGDPARLGKSRLGDLAEGKLTWPLLAAARRDPALGTDIRAIAQRRGVVVEASDLERIAERVVAVGAVAETRREARLHTSAAQRALSQLPPRRSQRALQAVIDFCTERAQ